MNISPQLQRTILSEYRQRQKLQVENAERKKESIRLGKLSQTQSFAGGILTGFVRKAVSAPRLVNLSLAGQKFSGFPRLPSGKLGIGLAAAGIGLGVAGEVNSIRSARKSDAPVRTYLKLSLLNVLNRTGGNYGGTLLGAGAIKGATALREATYAAKDSYRGYKAGASFTQATREKAQSAGQWVYRRIRGRIVRLKFRGAAGPSSGGPKLLG